MVDHRAAQKLREFQELKESLQQKPKRNTGVLIIAGTVVIVLLLIATALRLLTPKTLKVPDTAFVTTNPNGTRSRITGVKYVGPDIVVPEKLSVLTPSAQLSEKQVIEQLMAEYDLLKNPNTDVWTSKGAVYLHFDENEGSYSLVLNEPVNEVLPPVNLQSATQTAHNFINELFPNLSITPVENGITYLKLGVETTLADSPEQATAVGIPFSPITSAENYPLYSERSTFTPFAVVVDGKNQVRTFTFYPQFKNFAPLESVNSITIDQALENIKSGSVSVISASTDSNDRLALTDITAAEFTTVSIEYREDPDSGFTYPFYHFTGKGATVQGVEADIEVITPAIQTTPIQQRRS